MQGILEEWWGRGRNPGLGWEIGIHLEGVYEEAMERDMGNLAEARGSQGAQDGVGVGVGLRV